MRFQLVTQALLSPAVTSYRINSSHHNILTDSTLNHDVTSDEFLTKTFLLMLFAAMLHGEKSSLSYCETCLFIMQKGTFEYVKSYLLQCR